MNETIASQLLKVHYTFLLLRAVRIGGKVVPFQVKLALA